MKNISIFTISIILGFFLLMNAPFGKYYKVKSLYIDTQKKIEQNNIWYYCDKVWTILGADLKRSNGIYVKLYEDRKGNKSHSIDIDKMCIRDST